MSNRRQCWCGHSELIPFNSYYGECGSCGTLVSLNSLSNEQLIVQNDEVDFYGKQYWLSHQNDDLGFPDIYGRARYDLTERNLHWLKTLLKYCQPPANVMELGCAHGSFVALMQQVGYTASGLEMSEWVVSFGRQTFEVPIHLGPIENLDIPDGSLDVIALMDVLEHLPDPIGTLSHCAKLLQPNGFFLIQTPEFKKGMNYDNLRGTDSPFLEQLKSDEHLYLFNRTSVEDFLIRVGTPHIFFEPAIFSQYDMFLVAGKNPLKPRQKDDIETSLLSTPQSRIVLALLDLRDRELLLHKQFEEANTACVERLEQIHILSKLLEEADRDRSQQIEQIHTLTKWLQESEADRVHRLEEIHTLTGLLKECHNQISSESQ